MEAPVGGSSASMLQHSLAATSLGSLSMSLSLSLPTSMSLFLPQEHMGTSHHSAFPSTSLCATSIQAPRVAPSPGTGVSAGGTERAERSARGTASPGHSLGAQGQRCPLKPGQLHPNPQLWGCSTAGMGLLVIGCDLPSFEGLGKQSVLQPGAKGIGEGSQPPGAVLGKGQRADAHPRARVRPQPSFLRCRCRFVASW